MIIRNITDQISIALLQEEKIPRGSFIRAVGYVLHPCLIFRKIRRSRKLGQDGNILFDIILHISDILKGRIYKSKIVLQKKCSNQFVEIESNVFREPYFRFALYLWLHISFLSVRECCVQIRRQKWNLAIVFQTAICHFQFSCVLLVKRLVLQYIKHPYITNFGCENRDYS
jgi:hypothetical protein